MKTFVQTSALILSLILIGFAGSAQVRVTGHVYAEIVEAVAATSVTNNSLQIQQNAVGNNLELGEITLSGGASTACNVMITSKELTGMNGSQAAFVALPLDNSMPTSLDENGKTVIKIQGKAGEEILENPDKVYAGGYNVVFAYN